MLNKKIKKGRVEMSGRMNLPKRGQVGETVTWVVATIIIVVVLLISILVTSLYPADDKKIKELYFQTADVLASKSAFSYLLTKNGDKTVYAQIKEESKLNDFNGDLAQKVFRDLYLEDYLNNDANIWFGIVTNTGENCEKGKQFCILESSSNSFFGDRPGGSRGTALSYHTVPYTPAKIYLDETKYLEVVLIGK